MTESLKTLRRLIQNMPVYRGVVADDAITPEGAAYVNRRGGQELIGKMDVLVFINYALADKDALRKIAEEE